VTVLLVVRAPTALMDSHKHAHLVTCAMLTLQMQRAIHCSQVRLVTLPPPVMFPLDHSFQAPQRPPRTVQLVTRRPLQPVDITPRPHVRQMQLAQDVPQAATVQWEWELTPWTQSWHVQPEPPLAPVPKT
jgi:hypothetical protein